MQPEARYLHHVRIVLERKVVCVFVRSFDLPHQVFRKLVFELRVRELFQQNRREIYVGLQCQPLLLQLSKYPQQRKISFRSRFMQPFHPMRPRSMIHDVRKMGMQSKRHITQRFIGGFWIH
jgi:hypothetical protein